MKDFLPASSPCAWLGASVAWMRSISISNSALRCSACETGASDPASVREGQSSVALVVQLESDDGEEAFPVRSGSNVGIGTTSRTSASRSSWQLSGMSQSSRRELFALVQIWICGASITSGALLPSRST